MKYLLIASAVVGGILLFLLAAASADTSLFAGHYPKLLVLNVIIALALISLVGWQLWTLRRALKARKFGAQLTLRFLLIFALMAALPGALVYTVSVQFLAKSIESWFDVRVDTALDAGLDLGRSVLDNAVNDVRESARNMALELADMSAHQRGIELNGIREQANINEASIITLNGSVVAAASSRLTQLVPEGPPGHVMQQVRQNQEYASIEPFGEKGLQSRVIIPLPVSGWGEEAQWLHLVQPIPANVADSVETVQAAQRDYKGLSLLKLGLKRIYILTLTLALLLAMFSAIALAFILARRLSRPLSVLAEATNAVARGDFTRRAKVTSRDELGVLTKSFNAMTEQLGEAREQAERNREQVESARAHLENILRNLSAGVLTFDEAFRLQIVNAGAASILEEALEPGRTLAGWPALADLDAAIQEAFAEAKDGHWQRQLERPQSAQSLLLRGSTLPADAGYVVVFDDVTQLIAAQRATAWAEVARRLAHEIKNPLTPIQLSAERLQHKLSDKLEAEDAQTLVRATQTIVSQVNAMKAMVDEFRDYSRLPAPTLRSLDLNALVTEVLALYESWRSHIKVALDPRLPFVRGDATQLRQVIHNLLQNAQDALNGHADPHIVVRTELAGDKVRLCVSDNGGGFSESIMKRAFEPYVTTKPKGTGLGLAIVKKIVDEHHGTVTLENKAGAAVTIALPLAA
jgi:nitrogen fixation/metabolism regulation signal transduction histidine kinase